MKTQATRASQNTGSKWKAESHATGEPYAHTSTDEVSGEPEAAPLSNAVSAVPVSAALME
jgi:hypothetical protein